VEGYPGKNGERGKETGVRNCLAEFPTTPQGPEGIRERGMEKKACPERRKKSGKEQKSKKRRKNGGSLWVILGVDQ